MRRPRLWLMALAWAVLVALVALASPLWREADWAIFARAARNEAPPLLPSLQLVDLRRGSDLGDFRRRLLVQLDRMADPAERPRALVLDFEFESEPVLLPELALALRRLRDAGCKVYAASTPLEEGGALDLRYPERLPRAIYEGALQAHGHTVFGARAGIVVYRPWIDARDGLQVKALVSQIAEDLFAVPPDADARPIVVRTGRTVRPSTEAMGQRIVIVGDLRDDRTSAAPLAGPEYLLWALSARGQPQERAEARVVATPGLLLAMVVAAGALVAGTATLLWRLQPRWRDHPWAIAGVAALPPLALLGAATAALARLDLLLPQPTLPVLATLLAACTAAVAARRLRAWISFNAPDELPPEGWDVFVSYSRTSAAHARWVETQLVAPLRRLNRPDGRPLRVFFDQRALRQGDAWLLKLYRAIDACRFFVPVVSADYFDKDFCTREIAHALHRQKVGAVYILPLQMPGARVPSPYDALQAVRVDAAPGEPAVPFVALLHESMQRGWSQDAQAARAAEAGQAGQAASAAPGAGG